MDLVCKIVELLPEQRFNGRNGEVVRYSFVGETQGQYPKKVKFDVLGAERWDRLRPYVTVGGVSQVFFDVESRRWKENWFTSLTCYRVNGAMGSGGNAGSNTDNTQSQPNSVSNDNDPIPF